MIRDLLFQLEQKVEHATDLIELLRLQIEELEKANADLRLEQEQWKGDLVNLIKKFDQIDSNQAISKVSIESISATETESL